MLVREVLNPMSTKLLRLLLPWEFLKEKFPWQGILIEQLVETSRCGKVNMPLDVNTDLVSK